MTQRSYSRGWEIEWDGKQWIYSDTHKPASDKRACRRCGKMPTQEGYDACLGYIDGVNSACCGHGVEKPFMIKTNSGGTMIKRLKNFMFRYRDLKKWYRTLQIDLHMSQKHIDMLKHDLRSAHKDIDILAYQVKRLQRQRAALKGVITKMRKASESEE